MSIGLGSSLLSLEVILEQISDLALEIQRGTDLDALVQKTIANVRALLQTDRVLIYRFLPDQDAVVAFESVGAGWNPILGQLIYDPCIQASWVDRYQQGQTTSISNVHDGTVAPCYVQLLESIQVQANLVSPIRSHSQLWGLLIAHHCRSPRQWHALDVQYFQQIALHLGLAMQNNDLRHNQNPLASQSDQHKADSAAKNQTEMALQEMEQRFQAMSNSAPVLIWMSDIHGLCDFFNQGWLAFTGRTLEQELGHGWTTGIHPQDLDRCIDTYLTAFQARQPFEMEYRLRRADGNYRWILDHGNPRFTPDGEFVGFIGSCIDISDRKQKEDLIRNIAQGISAEVGAAFFHSLVNYLLPLLGMDHLFIAELIPAENSIRLIAGLGNGQVLDGLEIPLAGTPCKYVVEQGFQIYANHIQQHFPSSTLLQTLGAESYVGIPLVDSRGTVIGLIGGLSNQAITNIHIIQEVLTIFAARAASELERWQSEAMLRRYEQIVSTSSDCMALVDRHYTYQVVNQTYQAWIQKTDTEIVGHSVREVLGPDLFETQVKPHLDRCLAGESNSMLEAWLTFPDGQRRFVRANYAPVMEVDGTVSGVVANIHDLTALKQAELETQSLQKRLQFLLAVSPAAVYSCQSTGDLRCTFISENVTALLGYRPSDFLATNDFWLKHLHPDDAPRILTGLSHLFQDGVHSHEYRFQHRDGHYLWMHDDLRLVHNIERDEIEIVGCFTIIDDRKQAEIQLQNLSERLNLAVQSAKIGIWDWNVVTNQLIWDDRMDELYGSRTAELGGAYEAWIAAIHPDDMLSCETGYEQALAGAREFDMEFRVVWPDGSVHHIEAHGLVQRDAEGRPLRMIGTNRDISERKAAAVALQFSQAKYEALVTNMPGMVYRYFPQAPDHPHHFTFVSPQSWELLELAPETLIQDADTFVNLIHPEDLPSFVSSVTYAVEHFLPWHWEGRITTPSGRHKWIQGNSQAQCAPEGAAWDGLLVDISDRKAADIALREQQQFTEQIAESTLAILYVYDLIEQKNIYSNRQITRVLGYSPEEIQAMGDHFFPSLIHPEDLPHVITHQQVLLQAGDDEFVETEYRMRHKSGAYRWLLSRDRIFSRTQDGSPHQSLGVATDITAQKEAQARLNQQAERQRLLMAISQHIRQTLDLDRILQTTVAEVRQLLNTDRVVIYQFASDWSGTIIAESVTEEWRSILGMRITDTYFVNTQGRFYEQGRIKATHDIYTDNLDPCHIKLLEQMQVRAKLVVPILQGNHLWGLLVAQHCQSPRQWDPSDIDLQAQLAMQLAIAIQQADLYQQAQLELAERRRAEAALQELNQQLEQRVQERTQVLHQQAEQERLLRVIIQNIHRSLNLDEILDAVLSETRQTFQADRVTIYQFDADWSGQFIAESVGEGWVPLVVSNVPRVCEDTYLQKTQGGRYRHNETFAVSDIYTVGHQPCHIALLEQFQARAYAIAPIFLDGQLWGLLAAYQNSGPRQWQGWEVSLLRQIGIQMAIALRQSLLYESSQAQVHELERLNQLKDDFLSTVSHELRSPMSNIKMATQMVEISLKPLGVFDDQSNPINRYFKVLRDEGQREVNLINDLLDLARLDAGTEPSEITTIDLQCYIPHVAESFIERTQQQQQQLDIYIPEDLPPFTTDLPYLERIITELLHNACKYTPPGEVITVVAKAIENTTAGKTVELRVSNSGVSIPAEECDRIFDKFYRIPNGDPWKHGGTGLGLALVKKLTERLGGTIQVESCNGLTSFILEF